MKTRVLSATEFKAKCLAILNEVSEEGSSITVTKRGRPVAVVAPAKKESWGFPYGAWKGKVCLPKGWEKIDFTGRWEALRSSEATED